MKNGQKLLFLVAILSTTMSACESKAPANAAETVLTNGTIYTSNADQPTATAVAIDGGRFVYVGDDASAVIGPDTKVIECG